MVCSRSRHGLYHSLYLGLKGLKKNLRASVTNYFKQACIIRFVFVLKQVHRIYRSTGASFSKAQTEFSQGVMSNQAVQGAATNVATGAVKGMMANQGSQYGSSSGNKY